MERAENRTIAAFLAKSGCAVVMSTHNISLIEQFPSRTILFAKGGITEVDVKELI